MSVHLPFRLVGRLPQAPFAIVPLLAFPLAAGAFVPYERWAESALPLASGLDPAPRADPDGDALENAVEWFCGLSPEVFDPHPLTVEVTGGEIVVRFERSLEANASAAALQLSGDGQHWETSAAAAETGLPSSTHAPVAYRLPLAEAPEPGRMFRLAVSIPAEAARWTFDGTTADASRSGNDGNLRGGAVLGAGIAGTPGLSLDGTDDYLEVPDDKALRLDGADGEGRAFTVAAWIRLDANAPLAGEDDEYTILQKGLWTRPPFVQFGVRGGAFRGLWARIYSPDLTSHAYLRILPLEDLSALLPGQWRHVAFTRDEAGTGRLYLDGRMVAENPLMTGPVDSPTDAVSADGAVSPLHKVWIGRNYGRGGGYFRGELDELRVYRRALDADAIGEIVVQAVPAPGWERWAGYPPEDVEGTLYVAPDGDDGNSGTQEDPLASIGRALDMAHDPVETRLRIHVAHGEYHEGLNRFIRADAPLTDRLAGELIIARGGIALEAERPGKHPHQRVVVKGSVRRNMPAGHPIANRFPQWDALGGGLFRAERKGQDLNAQAIYLDGQPLAQSGDAWIAVDLTQYWLGSRYIGNNNPANLPEKSFYSAERMKLRVPDQGGLAIADGMRFAISRGNGADIVFEFNALSDYVRRAGSIPIPFANGRNAIGKPGDRADTQAQLAARILAALATPAAASLGLAPAYENGVIELGPRDRGDGTFMALSTGLASPLASHDYELFLKLPEHVDPNAPETALEIAYRTELLVIRAAGTRVRGFTFQYTNATAFIGAPAIVVNADDVVFEDNDVRWCDWLGLHFHSRGAGGLRHPVRNLLLLNNRFNHCGNSGLGNTSGLGCKLIGNDTSHNNWRNFNPSWHAGGFKFLSLLQDMMLCQHTARSNRGDGLWFDTVDYRYLLFGNEPAVPDQFGVTVTESVAEFNQRAGFFYEGSLNGAFHDNVSRYNGQRGFYLSSTVSSRVERNLAVGNGIDGVGYNATVRSLQLPYFAVPRTHPLAENWANNQFLGGIGSAGNRVSNNIIRNSALYNAAHHDPWDRHLGILPVHPASGFPFLFLPAETGGVDLAPVVTSAVTRNESDSNVLWKTGEPILYGYSPAYVIDLAHYSPKLGIDGAMLDLKDLDFGLDGKADRIWTRHRLFDDGKPFSYFAFPSPEDIAYGQGSTVADRFEFLDPPELKEDPPGADDVVNPDLDGDGLYDWWEASHGLDPQDAEGVNGADGDPDADGLTNAREFDNWKHGSTYTDLATYRKETDPTRGQDNRDGKPRDLDGDGLPDLWESWFGLDPGDGSDGAPHVEAFLRNELPLPLANDSDADGLPDDWEMTAFGSLDEGADDDTDNDGYSNALEFRYWTLPFDPADPVDADKDGLPDTWELVFGFASLPGADRGADGDPDGDGSPNIEEFRALTNPREARGGA